MRIVVALILGATCGSFAAAVADRVPRGESISAGRSRCRGCGRHLGVRDLVPVFSWLVLGGRCRWCSTSIGSTTLVAEVSTAALFAVCAVRIESATALVAHWILCTGLMALSVIDMFTLRLPRRIIHVTAALGASALVVASMVAGEPERMMTAAVGALMALGAMALLYAASRGKLGDGDVRLSPLLGLFLGWKSLSAVHSGFLLSFVLGAVVGLGFLCATRSDRSRAIPFGPFLAAGTMLALLFDIDVIT